MLSMAETALLAVLGIGTVIAKKLIVFYKC